MAKVLVIGASQGIGLETVKQALAAGHTVRAMARSASRIPIDHPNLEKFAGDALDVASVRKALSGMDAVIQRHGVAVLFRAAMSRTFWSSKSKATITFARRLCWRISRLSSWSQDRQHEPNIRTRKNAFA